MVPDPLPQHPLPKFANRRDLVDLIHRVYGVRTTPRTLERWPLTWRRVQGRAIAEVAEAFAVVEARISAAPPIRGGRQPATTDLAA